jgi:2'-5' RNA ligase
MREPKAVRLFFALWPDQAVRRQIVSNLEHQDIDFKHCRLVSSNNLHMTLHFIGNTSLDEMACLERQASAVCAEPFNLMIDYSGYFKKPKVIWFACQQVPQALYDLHRALGQQISQCAFEPEQRPYSPHITVVRKINTELPAVPLKPIPWKVDRFVLIESISIPGGVRYQIVKSYPLSGA